MRGRSATVASLAAILLMSACTTSGGTTSSEPAASVTSVGPASSMAPTASSAPAWMVAPVGVIGPDGALYGGDCDAARIFRVAATGVTVIAGAGPTGFAADFAGDGGPATTAHFACPAGVAFDGTGNLLVVDHANNRVPRIDTHGVVTTIAGSGPAGVNLGAGVHYYEERFDLRSAGLFWFNYSENPGISSFYIPINVICC